MFELLALQDKVWQGLCDADTVDEGILYLIRGRKLQVETAHSFDSCSHIHTKLPDPYSRTIILLNCQF